MADDTPETPGEGGAPEQAKPAPRRRAAPRKPAATKAPARDSKDVVTQAEETVSRAATAVKDAAVDAGERAARAVKPRSSSRPTPRPAAARGRAAPAAETARTTKRAPAKAARGTAAKRSPSKTPARAKPDKSTVEKATEAVGGRWAAAAIAGVAAAAGATAAAVLTLRGSTRTQPPAKPAPTNPAATAHQPDGTDSSKSFQAGIADENTVPDAE